MEIKCIKEEYIEKLWPGLTVDVKNYFLDYNYGQEKGFFKLKGFAHSKENGRKKFLYVIPKGLEKSIKEKNQGWKDKLNLIGKKYDVELKIPEVFYEKEIKEE